MASVKLQLPCTTENLGLWDHLQLKSPTAPSDKDWLQLSRAQAPLTSHNCEAVLSRREILLTQTGLRKSK